jgi:2-oxoglutarate ferredoxin oxidoreductase subunit delta
VSGDRPGDTVDRVADVVPEIRVDAALCKKCGICVAVCPEDVYVERADGLPVVVQGELCIWCERCEIYCPDYAIRLVGRRGW